MTCPEAESNHRHEDFQSSALPTELSGQKQTGFNSTRRKYFVSRNETSSFINKETPALFLKNRGPLNTEKRGMERWFFLLRCVCFPLSIRQASKEAVRQIHADPLRPQNERHRRPPCRSGTQASSRNSPRTQKASVLGSR